MCSNNDVLYTPSPACTNLTSARRPQPDDPFAFTTAAPTTPATPPPDEPERDPLATGAVPMSLPRGREGGGAWGAL